MLKLHVNKFGGRDQTFKIPANQSYTNSKFITLSNNLARDLVDLVNKKYLNEHLACRLNDDDTRIIMNNFTLKVN